MKFQITRMKNWNNKQNKVKEIKLRNKIKKLKLERFIKYDQSKLRQNKRK